MTSPISFRPHRYRSACGRLDLHARIYDKGQDRGSDQPTLLLMHGLTRNSADFEPLAEELAVLYRLVVPDQRGRGLSEYDSNPGNYRPDIYADDMFALLDGLGIAKVGLIGTSMGGLIAMIMVAAQPERIASIVLNDIGPHIEAAGLARIQGYVGPMQDAADWDEAAASCAAVNAIALPDFGRHDWLAFARRTCIQTPEGRIRFAYDPAIALSTQGTQPATLPPDLWPLWGMLAEKPVLVLRGSHSDLLAAATVAEMGKRHGAAFTAVDVPNRGHAPILDEPVALSAIDAFLQTWAF
ncbi:alpha/beta hydrolase [Novosphingobium sp. AAP83]|uniref:alpha/beta fold hydrolase n=1 Tax=Novosphingobium sp. AAP83 TaxID=1523425 RepID=UPI0006B90FB8|nr:alpha/beta hydrolase [Novosphingobium sp. AAP83]KPF91125.1 alpha/beta hydrolase [Novosphingobium sp. AAP83]